MKAFLGLILGLAAGCESTEIENGDGTVTVISECKTASEKQDASEAGADAPGVVDTCDDHLPCTVDIQCTPCSAVPEDIRFVKATCTQDKELSPFCFDASTDALVYTGCVHFIQDPTPPGVINACFPVAFALGADGNAFGGVCNGLGVCTRNPAP